MAKPNRHQNEADLQRRHEQQLFAAQDEGARKALAEEKERKRKFEQDYPRTEYQKQAMKDHPNRAQVMICGACGTGKSKLINLLMQVIGNVHALGRGDRTVARAAVSALGECTERPTVYTFAEASPLFHLAIMIDTPGAGTLLVPEDTYPRMIGIRYATIVLLVVADRLRAIDHKIYKECPRHRVPVLVVRSKMDNAVENAIADAEDAGQEPPTAEQTYEAARANVISKAANPPAESGVPAIQIPPERIYLTSRNYVKGIHDVADFRVRDFYRLFQDISAAVANEVSRDARRMVA
ncbi:unnamed protein product [Vitrella brassicaformis CCMP3155]|uniref:IRG-type G domain-containing protein n=1 Tax=Vitrella brassicaformis (strain CCMP3155) TaxID=1169540 RepID=A0A0G4H2M3_VITBC|nr:unnamed protein product [Vitrella brassicaformis CCMP3155]|eukprot:CEM37888.1 unnamed protein product [Vitrella brassicaformis CCMP3155]